jgi:hypothetical protein
VSLLEYDNGGMELKTIIGLHDILYLGVSFDVQNAIGKDDPKPNVPGVIARLKFTDGWEEWPISIAAGYDSFFIGEQGKRENVHNPLDRMIYGPYLAITKAIYLFDDEQYLSYGLRVPTQPDYVPEDTSYYVALDIPLARCSALRARLKGCTGISATLMSGSTIPACATPIWISWASSSIFSSSPMKG